MARALNWVPGEPATPGGTVYFMRAWHKDDVFWIAKAICNGVEKFSLWKNKTPHGCFDVRLDALNHAETLI